MDNTQITLMYYFIGFSGTRRYEDKTGEGKLYWINENELLEKPMSFEIRSVLEHHLKIGHASSDINVGTISFIENKPTISWKTLDAWEGIMGM